MILVRSEAISSYLLKVAVGEVKQDNRAARCKGGWRPFVALFLRPLLNLPVHSTNITNNRVNHVLTMLFYRQC